MVIQAVVDEGDGMCSCDCSVLEMTHMLVAKGRVLFPDCLGHAHVLLAAFERVSRAKLRFETVFKRQKHTVRSLHFWTLTELLLFQLSVLVYWC